MKKIKSNVKHGHYFRVADKLFIIPAGLVVDVTEPELVALEAEQSFKKSIEKEWLTIQGRKKKKKEADDVDDNPEG